jgi:hypothetical protein
VHLTAFVDAAGGEQNSFGGGGLPGIDVSQDAEIADMAEFLARVSTHSVALQEDFLQVSAIFLNPELTPRRVSRKRVQASQVSAARPAEASEPDTRISSYSEAGTTTAVR